MTIRPIICIPDPKLRLVSKPVDAVDDDVRALMDDMLETMYDAPGIGLAAIQIAQPARVVVIDCAGREGADPAPIHFANPEITWTSEDLHEYEEGCLSIPEYFEIVDRPAECKVKYLDYQGAVQETHCSGILATCIQHEIDHLNGVLFIDYLSRLKRDRVMRKFKKAAKERARDALSDQAGPNREEKSGKKRKFGSKPTRGYE